MASVVPYEDCIDIDAFTALVARYQLLLHVNATQWLVPVAQASPTTAMRRTEGGETTLHAAGYSSLVAAISSSDESLHAAVATGINSCPVVGQFEVPYAVAADDVSELHALCSEFFAATVASSDTFDYRDLLKVVQGASPGVPVIGAGSSEPRKPRVAELLSAVASVRRLTWSAPPVSSAGNPQTASKKCREVEGMVSLLDRVAATESTRTASDEDDAEVVFVDVGAGQGDLVSAIASSGRHAVAVDRDDVQVHGSLKKAVATAGAGHPFGVCKIDLRSDTQPSAFRGVVADGLTTAFGADERDKGRPVVLCSLHACGALSPNLLNIFHKWNRDLHGGGNEAVSHAASRCDAVVNLSCCYNLLAAGEATCIAHAEPGTVAAPNSAVPARQRSFGAVYSDFPLSARVRSAMSQVAHLRPVVASRSALMAACQAPSTWNDDVFAPLFRRSVAQVVLASRGLPGPQECGRVRETKSAPGARTSDRYTASIVKALRQVRPPPAGAELSFGVTESDTKRHRAEPQRHTVEGDEPGSDEGAIAASLDAVEACIVAQRLNRWYAVAWTVRALLGELLEALLLADRCEWLKEAEADAAEPSSSLDVRLVPVVPPTVSPRNLALVAVRSRGLPRD